MTGKLEKAIDILRKSTSVFELQHHTGELVDGLGDAAKRIATLEAQVKGLLARPAGVTDQ